jgi:hypothetical protein
MTAWDVRAGCSGPAGAAGCSGSVTRCPGIAPSRPGDWLAVCTTGSGSADGRSPALSSLVQSSTTGPTPDPVSGPASANS